MKRTGFMDSESALFARVLHAKRSNQLNVQLLHIQRVAHCNRLLRHYGIAPVTISSGKMSRTCRRIARTGFLHQTFFEFASKSLQYCRWAKTYYNAQRAAGKCFGSAVRSLAFKWQRIIYACWKNHETYDDARYTEQLSRRGSPHAVEQ